MNIILCGPPLCGKTTLGKILAKKLHWPFVDTDELIEKLYLSRMKQKASCRDIYRLYGGNFFYSLEKKVVASLSPEKPSIIATGGGCLVCSENGIRLKSLGTLIYLKASMETLWERTSKRGVPSYLCQKDPRSSFEKLIKIREPHYENFADIILDITSMHQEEVIFYILSRTTLLRRYHG